MPADTWPAVWTDDSEAKRALIADVRTALGDGMIDLELGEEHLDLAVRKAVDRYRTRSTNAFEHSFFFIEVQKDQNEYTMPPEVSEVITVYRRGASGTTAGGTFFDPFAASFINSIYALPYATGGGDLATYDFAMQYQTLVGRMFGLEVQFLWDRHRHTLIFHRKWAAKEILLVDAWNVKPLSSLLSQFDTRQWLRDCAVAYAKLILAEPRSLYSSLPVPGGVTLNGEQLKTEAQAELERLEEELVTLKDGPPIGYGFRIG